MATFAVEAFLSGYGGVLGLARPHLLASAQLPPHLLGQAATAECAELVGYLMRLYAVLLLAISAQLVATFIRGTNDAKRQLLMVLLVGDFLHMAVFGDGWGLSIRSWSLHQQLSYFFNVPFSVHLVVCRSIYLLRIGAVVPHLKRKQHHQP